MITCNTGCGNIITDDNQCQTEAEENNEAICNYCCTCKGDN